MPDPVVHFEIAGKDARRIQQFYASLFGWEIDTSLMGGAYGLVGVNQGSIAGGLMAAPDGRPSQTIYVQVDDLQVYLEKAQRLGGRTLVQPTEIPGSGAWALIEDPDGNAVGLYQR